MRVPQTVTALVFNVPLAELPDSPTRAHVAEEIALTFRDYGTGAVYLDGPDGEEIGSVERFTIAGGASFSGWVARVGRDYSATAGLNKAQALLQLTLMVEEHLNAKLGLKNGRSLSARFAAVAA